MKPNFKFEVTMLNGKWAYVLDNKLARCSKREYSFALLGLAKEELGASKDGEGWFLVGLGNYPNSLYYNWRDLYSHCELKLVNIVNCHG